MLLDALTTSYTHHTKPYTWNNGQVINGIAHFPNETQIINKYKKILNPNIRTCKVYDTPNPNILPLFVYLKRVKETPTNP